MIFTISFIKCCCYSFDFAWLSLCPPHNEGEKGLLNRSLPLYILSLLPTKKTKMLSSSAHCTKLQPQQRRRGQPAGRTTACWPPVLCHHTCPHTMPSRYGTRSTLYLDAAKERSFPPHSSLCGACERCPGAWICLIRLSLQLGEAGGGHVNSAPARGLKKNKNLCKV